MAHSMDVLSRLGARFHAEPSKRWWPRQAIPWLGFYADTKAMRVRLRADELEKGKALCLRCASTATGDGPSAREIRGCAFYLNLLEWPVPGGSCHLRSRGVLVKRPGVMEKWR